MHPFGLYPRRDRFSGLVEQAERDPRADDRRRRGSGAEILLVQDGDGYEVGELVDLVVGVVRELPGVASDVESGEDDSIASGEQIPGARVPLNFKQLAARRCGADDGYARSCAGAIPRWVGSGRRRRHGGRRRTRWRRSGAGFLAV